MHWVKNWIHIPTYERTSGWGSEKRFRQKRCFDLPVAEITVKRSKRNIEDMETLILLSHVLDVPVRYKFKDPQEMFIKVVSAESLREILKI